MFDKILIANRGEIACRIARTARRMGIATVAVYSQADRNALHVEMADEAVEIGPARPSESYLSIERIVAACRETGAQAVHPGYGFLAENAAFPRALAEAGIVFIGPPSAAIEAMGDKLRSKEIAAKAGLSIVPGHASPIVDADEAVGIAQAIGFPVMLKASAGGGGKGMRVARDQIETREGFERARSEAKSSFGDDRILIEKFIEEPRHIEIQVLADQHGACIHLGERECSIQRRNQKVVEEAPSAFLDAATRAAMGAQAVALARAVGYESAGTVEFIADSNRSFYFLEMNTRLQVEHPVTELVTGLDLVEEMIRIAAGEPLRIRQDEVRFQGWAIESRIYAEDPYRNFLPSVGRLTRYAPPPPDLVEGATIRNDAGVVEGSEIALYYDPLIAKLCTHAPDRQAATNAMAEALDAFVLDGIRHNIPFLSVLMAHRRWREGRISTALIAEEFPNGLEPLPLDEAEVPVFAALAACAGLVEAERLARADGAEGAAPASSEWVAMLDRRPVPVRLVAGEPQPPLVIELAVGDGHVLRVETAWRPGERVWRGKVGEEFVTAQLVRAGHEWLVSRRGKTVRARLLTARAAELAALMPERAGADTGRHLLCPMPGVVLAVMVAEGQKVEPGEPLATVEAMKMENVLRAEREAVVAKVHVAPGDSLAVDQVIMEFE
jgi:propionyl-CoA carboxylase alpha chain